VLKPHFGLVIKSSRNGRGKEEPTTSETATSAGAVAYSQGKRRRAEGPATWRRPWRSSKAMQDILCCHGDRAQESRGQPWLQR